MLNLIVLKKTIFLSLDIISIFMPDVALLVQGKHNLIKSNEVHV